MSLAVVLPSETNHSYSSLAKDAVELPARTHLLDTHRIGICMAAHRYVTEDAL